MARKTETAAITEREIFPTKLRSLFQDSGKSRAELADYLGVTTSSIGYYATGQSKPSLDAVAKIAEFFHVSTDYLLTGTEIKTADIDKRGVCKYLGLSEEAVDALHMTADKAARITAIDFLVRDEKFLAYLASFLWVFSFKKLPESDYAGIPLKTKIPNFLQDVMYSSLIKYLPKFGDKFQGEYENSAEIIDSVLFDYVRRNVDISAAVLLSDDPGVAHAFGYIHPDELEAALDDLDDSWGELTAEDIEEMEADERESRREEVAARRAHEKASENATRFLLALLREREANNGEHQTD